VCERERDNEGTGRIIKFQILIKVSFLFSAYSKMGIMHKGTYPLAFIHVCLIANQYLVNII
jgi:hypothetical protein